MLGTSDASVKKQSGSKLAKPSQRKWFSGQMEALHPPTDPLRPQGSIMAKTIYGDWLTLNTHLDTAERTTSHIRIWVYYNDGLPLPPSRANASTPGTTTTARLPTGTCAPQPNHAPGQAPTPVPNPKFVTRATYLPTHQPTGDTQD